MPRTKAPKKRTVSVDETVNVDQTKKKTLREKISEVEDDFKSATSKLKNALDIDILKIEESFSQIRLQVLNSNIGHKTLKELRNEIEVDDKHSLISSSSKGSSAKSAASGFLKPKAPRQVRKRSNSCTTRSSKTSQATNTRSASSDRCRNNQLLRTPDSRGDGSIVPVTPKVNPSDPVSVLRRPHQGEYAISLLGSPLFVSNMASDSMPSVTVPMADGNVISILPTEGIHSANLELDAHTRRMLMKLKSNIDKCLQKQE